MPTQGVFGVGNPRDFAYASDLVKSIDRIAALGKHRCEGHTRATIDAHVAMREHYPTHGQSTIDKSDGAVEIFKGHSLTDIIDAVVAITDPRSQRAHESLIRPLNPGVKNVGHPGLGQLIDLLGCGLAVARQAPPTSRLSVTKLAFAMANCALVDETLVDITCRLARASDNHADWAAGVDTQPIDNEHC